MPTVSGTVSDSAGNVATWAASWTEAGAETAPLMGCSASPNDHGGTDVWDGWRAYTETTLYQVSNRQGSLRPKFMAYSKQSAPLGGTSPVYSTVFNEVLADLNDYYYTTPTGQTHSTRWGIKLYWFNGNEMANKGMLTEPHNATKIAAFVTSQRALFDACHYVDPTTGQRRFPDAYAGSDPTTTQEKSGIVEGWLHPSAQYHDFVAWSNYPGGRDDTAADPTFDFASTNPAQGPVAPVGYVVRCVERTKAAGLAAGKTLGYVVGEVGCGNDPDDGTTRPYWIVHGFMDRLLTCCENADVPLLAVCWWDNQTDTNTPQNILSDEQAGLNPTSRQAFQGHLSYNHLRGGTHPSSWAGAPRSAWKTSGTVT